MPEEAQPEPIPAPVVEEAKEEPVVEEKRIDEEPVSQSVFEAELFLHSSLSEDNEAS